MLKKKIVSSLFALACVLCTAPVQAFIVHHCDYTPASVTQEVHQRHAEKNGCGNLDDAGDGQIGHCDISTAFYWAEMDCDANGCHMFGKIDCGANDKSYDFFCPGSGSDRARVDQNRTEATCDSPVAGSDHSCTCDGPCS